MRRDAHGGGCVCWRCTYRSQADNTPPSREFLADPFALLSKQLERAKPWTEEQRHEAAREAARQEAWS